MLLSLFLLLHYSLSLAGVEVIVADVAVVAVVAVAA